MSASVFQSYIYLVSHLEIYGVFGGYMNIMFTPKPFRHLYLVGQQIDFSSAAYTKRLRPKTIWFFNVTATRGRLVVSVAPTVSTIDRFWDQPLTGCLLVNRNLEISKAPKSDVMEPTYSQVKTKSIETHAVSTSASGFIHSFILETYVGLFKRLLLRGALSSVTDKEEGLRYI